MRTVNGSAVSVDYNAHSGGPNLSGTVRWKDVEKVDDRPVAYCAAGSHGLWPTPGQHELAPVSRNTHQPYGGASTLILS